MGRRKLLTIENHRQASKALLSMDKALSEFFNPPLNGRIYARTVDRLLRLDGAIHTVKSELENMMMHDYSKNPEANTDVYYPREDASKKE